METKNVFTPPLLFFLLPPKDLLLRKDQSHIQIPSPTSSSSSSSSSSSFPDCCSKSSRFDKIKLHSPFASFNLTQLPIEIQLLESPKEAILNQKRVRPLRSIFPRRRFSVCNFI
ncbi:unnamed protein product [Linum tenue]|uniref:Uncharacterized protein n=1 Tax=Linum tenue TaxID=586396 RepID=A0AAV0J7L7_9ROSI|nr:unnamed protein product [Linum tenue]